MNVQISYGRKQPGPQDYSSESLHITLTQEVGDEVEDNDLRQAIAALYDMIKQEVDQRLHVQAQPSFPSQRPTFGNGGGNGGGVPSGNRVMRANGKASPKQVNFLLSLANKRGVSFEQLGQWLQQEAGTRDPYQLSVADASRLIDQLKGSS